MHRYTLKSNFCCVKILRANGFQKAVGHFFKTFFAKITWKIMIFFLLASPEIFHSNFCLKMADFTNVIIQQIRCPKYFWSDIYLVILLLHVGVLNNFTITISFPQVSRNAWIVFYHQCNENYIFIKNVHVHV